MRTRKLNGIHIVLAAVIATMVVMPIAFAGAKGSGATTSSKRQIRALTQRVAALEGKQGQATPATLPPSGPAGGDLTGTYPKPQIGPDTVGTDEIANGSVGSADFGPSVVGSRQLAVGAVGGVELKDAVAVQGAGINVAPGSAQTATVTCPQDHSRVLSGGPEWLSNANGTAIIASSPSFAGNPNTTWVVTGRVDTGGAANTIFAEALCVAN